jgi:hypothetical protein
MCAAIGTPAKCDIRTVIHFLQADGHSAAEIHRRMSAVYGPNFMSDVLRSGAKNFTMEEQTRMMRGVKVGRL